MAALTLEMAEKAVKAAQAKARDQGTPMTVTVVDEAGRLVLSARGDGAGFFTPETSRGKAVAAAAFRRPTKEMVRLRDSSPAFWSNISNVLHGEALPSIGGSAGSLRRKSDRRHRLRWRQRRARSPLCCSRRRSDS